MDLKTLFSETLPAYYNAAAKKETHVYMSNVNEAIDEAKERIQELHTEYHLKGDTDIAYGIKLAKDEIAFTSSEILLKQLKSIGDE